MNQGDSSAAEWASRLPPPSRRAAAAADEVLRALLTDTTRFLDSETVGRRLSREPNHSTSRSVASRARKARVVIGVWDGSAFRYPAFQFDNRGQLLERLRDLIDILPLDADGSYRSAALWLFAPDAALGGQCPAQAFPTNPDRVVALRQHRLDTASAAE